MISSEKITDEAVAVIFTAAAEGKKLYFKRSVIKTDR